MSEPTKGAVVATQLVKVYRGLTEEVQAVRGVDLVLEPGSLTAVLGPSGSGKSTLIRLLAGLDRPSAGTVSHGATALTDLSTSRLRRWRRRNVAFVHQRPRSNLVEHFTAAEQLRMVGAAHGRQSIDEVLASLGLAEQAQHRVDQLSGGEQQRLALLAAMATGRSLLVADEPTAHLDDERAGQVLDRLRLHRRARRDHRRLHHSRPTDHRAGRPAAPPRPRGAHHRARRPRGDPAGRHRRERTGAAAARGPGAVPDQQGRDRDRGRPGRPASSRGPGVHR